MEIDIKLYVQQLELTVARQAVTIAQLETAVAAQSKDQAEDQNFAPTEPSTSPDTVTLDPDLEARSEPISE